MKVFLKKIIGKSSPAAPANMVEETDYDDDALFQGYQVSRLVAKGSFGKVYKVRKIVTAQCFAMKVVPKDRLMEMNEERILSKLDHNLVIRLRHSFQTEMNLYLVFNFIHGGDLRFLIRERGFFNEEIARFYAAELVAAVAYLHENGIMHRDIKPSNILVDSQGHLVLTDFGMALEFNINKPSDLLSTNFCGTVSFMAPEVYLKRGYGISADWWSVGVTVYEMLTGAPLFKAENRRDLMIEILHGELRLPEYLTGEARSFLNGLLSRNPKLRLGQGGSEEIKEHKWFRCIDWKKLQARGIRPPVVHSYY